MKRIYFPSFPDITLASFYIFGSDWSEQPFTLTIVVKFQSIKTVHPPIRIKFAAYSLHLCLLSPVPTA